jgi:hypothetical protein
MIDIEASVSTWRNCFSAFYLFCLRSGKGLTRRANQEHKNIIAEFVNARSGISAAGILLPRYATTNDARPNRTLCASQHGR